LTLDISTAILTDDLSSCDLLGFVAGRGHREFPCLSRAHNPSSCVPCLDFSPWLRERVRREDVDGLAEYLWRVRRASPSVDSPDRVHSRYVDLARAIMAAPIDRHLSLGSDDAYIDLRTAMVMVAAHEGFSGFIMAGEAAYFMAAVMAPYVDALRHLSANPGAPRSLASLCRQETIRHGLEVAESSRLILESGLVSPATDMAAWLEGWTRRDLIGFLRQAGYRAPKSQSKERLAVMAMTERPDAVREKMAESGAVELAPEHAEAAHRLRGYLEDVKETWRVWLGFGTGVVVEESR